MARSHAPAPDPDLPAGLELTLTVSISRHGRGRCPRCGLRRVLVAVTVFGENSPVGYGEVRCLDCADLRIRVA